jgi:hypothetical protein
MVNLGDIPAWLLWVMAMSGMAAVTAAAIAITPREKKRRTLALMPAALLIFIARAAVSREPRLVLWFAFTLSWAVAAVVALFAHTAGRASTAAEMRRRTTVWNIALLVVIAATVAGSYFVVE